MGNPNMIEGRFEGWPSNLPGSGCEGEDDGPNRLSAGRHSIADGVSEPNLVPEGLSKSQNDRAATKMDAVPSGLVLGGRGGESPAGIDGGLGDDSTAEGEALPACESHAGGLFQEVPKIQMDIFRRTVSRSLGGDAADRSDRLRESNRRDSGTVRRYLGDRREPARQGDAAAEDTLEASIGHSAGMLDGVLRCESRDNPRIEFFCGRGEGGDGASAGDGRLCTRRNTSDGGSAVWRAAIFRGVGRQRDFRSFSTEQGGQAEAGVGAVALDRESMPLGRHFGGGGRSTGNTEGDVAMDSISTRQSPTGSGDQHSGSETIVGQRSGGTLSMAVECGASVFRSQGSSPSQSPLRLQSQCGRHAGLRGGDGSSGVSNCPRADCKRTQCRAGTDFPKKIVRVAGRGIRELCHGRDVVRSGRSAQSRSDVETTDSQTSCGRISNNPGTNIGQAQNRPWKETSILRRTPPMEILQTYSRRPQIL